MKKTSIKFFAMFLSLLMAISSLPITGLTVEAAARPKLAKKSTSIVVGETSGIKVKNAPKGAKITYKTANKSIATVSKKGIVKGVKSGSTKIAVSIKKNLKTTKLSYKVTVKKFKLSKSILSLSPGGTAKLSVKNKPKKATYVWSSSNSEVASVSKNGKVTAKAKGTATIKVSVRILKKKYNLSCKVMVEDLSDGSGTQTSEPKTSETQTYIVAFNSNGGSAVASQTVKKYALASRPADPVRSGYTFDGWYTALAGGQKFDFNIAITGNIMLYAHWTKILSEEPEEPTSTPTTYTVTFDSNGGSVVESQTVKENALASRPTDPVRSGYTFDGWYTTASDGEIFDFDIAITDNITLYAHWTEINVDFGEGPFEVIFYANDGSDGIYKKQTIKKNELVNEPENPVRDMYRFTGWYTESEAINKYDFKTPCRNSFTLYAGWGNPDGSDDLYAASNDEETIYSITAIEVNEDEVIVTYNTNSQCLMSVDFFEDEMSGSDWSKEAQISNLNSAPITTTADYTENYGEMITIALPINDTLPDNFVVRATLYGTGEDKDPTYVSNQYTAAYKEFEAQTVDSVIDEYGEDLVINFDNDRTTNFGVLKNSVKVITTESFDNGFEVTDVDVEGETVPDHEFIFTNADDQIRNLQVGEIIYLEGTTWLFKIGNISKSDNGTVIMTQDKEVLMTDFYDVLQVDMEGSDINANISDNDNGIATHLEIIDVDASLTGSIYSSINKKFENGIKLTGSLGVEVTGNVEMSYDAHLFSADYFECSVSFITEISAEINAGMSTDNDNTWKNVVFQVDTRKIQLPTPVTGLCIYVKPSTQINWSLSGDVSVKLTSKQTSGFKYNSDTGRTDIKEKETTVSVMAEGKAEAKVGPIIDIGVEFLKGVLNAGVVAEAGVIFTAEAEAGADDVLNNVDSKHACALCVSGKAEWYATASVKCGYKIIKHKFEGDIANLTILDFRTPVYFLPNVPGKFFVSVINSTDSPFGGKIKFGGGSCTNKTYRTVIDAIDVNGNEVNGVKVDIRKHEGNFADSGNTQYVLYLYDGIYTIQGNINNVTSQKTFTVSSSAQSINLEQGANNGGSICGNVQDVINHENLSNVDIVVWKDSTIIASATTNDDGNFDINVPVGSYTVGISKEGYITSTVCVDVFDAQEKTLSIQLIPKTQNQGGFSGTIVEADSGNPIEGATLKLRKGWNNTTGDVVLTLTTDVDGKYASKTIEILGFVFGLAVGDYTLTVSKSGYRDKSFSFKLFSSGTANDLGEESLVKKIRYQVFDIPMTWGNAKAFCESLGGHLATITSQEEQGIVERLVANSSMPSYWLGATDNAHEGTWVWVTGEAWSYTHWGREQPDNCSGENGSVENYLEICNYDQRISSGYWNDLQYRGDPSKTPGFICEWD